MRKSLLVFSIAVVSSAKIKTEPKPENRRSFLASDHFFVWPWDPEQPQSGSVSSSQKSLRTFGAPRYPDDLPQPSWEDLREQGRLGATCSGDRSAASQCGRELVCRRGICRRCQKDTECQSLQRCSNNKLGGGICVPIEKLAWERALTDPYEGWCTVAIFFASALAAAAGTGGGGMFVPIFVSLSGLKTNFAVPCSQFIILCGSIVNLAVFSSARHPMGPRQPLIDYDCVVLMEPMLCLGVIVGILMNQVSPQWFLLVLLVLTLGVALWRTATKGICQLKAENENPPELLVATLAREPTPLLRETTPRLRSCFDDCVPRTFVELTNMKAWQLILTVMVWLAMLASSFHGFPVCSRWFIGYLVEISGLLLLCTYIAGRRMRAESGIWDTSEVGMKGQIDWTASGVFVFPTAAFGAGFIGGLLGLGGGIIMSPVLLEVGMHSEAVQATTAVFVFLSSSLATIQFARLGQIVWHYAAWYAFVTVTATAVGQYICDVYARRRGRYSMITLSIAGVLLVSMLALLVIGSEQVLEDVYMGRQMWFSIAGLCNKDGRGILAPEVTPAGSWPSDLPPWKHR